MFCANANCDDMTCRSCPHEGHIQCRGQNTYHKTHWLVAAFTQTLFLDPSMSDLRSIKTVGKQVCSSQLLNSTLGRGLAMNNFVVYEIPSSGSLQGTQNLFHSCIAAPSRPCTATSQHLRHACLHRLPRRCSCFFLWLRSASTVLRAPPPFDCQDDHIVVDYKVVGNCLIGRTRAFLLSACGPTRLDTPRPAPKSAGGDCQRRRCPPP